LEVRKKLRFVGKNSQSGRIHGSMLPSYNIRRFNFNLFLVERTSTKVYWKRFGFRWVGLIKLLNNRNNMYITLLYFIAHSTPIDWANFCREVAEYIMINNSEKIGGPGFIVEIDESKF
jgi:hypothetical protein